LTRTRSRTPATRHRQRAWSDAERPLTRLGPSRERGRRRCSKVGRMPLFRPCRTAPSTAQISWAEENARDGFAYGMLMLRELISV
jgi:hypothetical protein